MSIKSDVIILGGGLAGLSTAKELIDRGLKVCLTDTQQIAAGASGVPIGLANYATGRYAKLSWEAEKCMDKLIQNLKEVQIQTPVQIWKQNGVLRPALNEDIASKSKENYESTDWPDNAGAEWLDSDSLNSLNPHVTSGFGGLWVSDACTVITPLYLQSLCRMLEEAGLILIHGNYELKKDSEWTIKTATEHIEAPLLIDCTGYELEATSIQLDLKLTPVKGQLLLFKRQAPIPFDHSLSALGYIGQMDQNYFAVGSTYEHNFDDLKVNEQGQNQLIEKVKRVCPMLLEEAEIIEHWSGVRASTPNRLPIVGPHPSMEGLYLFKGLGSKGLLFSGYISTLVADHITEAYPLPDEIDIQRFY